MRWAAALLIVLALMAPSKSRADADAVARRIEKPVLDAIDIRQKTAKEQEQWRDEKQKRITLYDQLQREQADLEGRRRRLLQDRDRLRQQVADRSAHLEQARILPGQLAPFLDEAVARLESFCGSDLPFLQVERRRRLDRLKASTADPDLPLSEKLRKVLEALMVEAQYGLDIEVGRETLQIDGQPLLVDTFRLGRIALFYRSLDGRRCGYYSVAESGWRPLPPDRGPAIGAAIEIGAKRRPAELLTLPIGRLSVP